MQVSDSHPLTISFNYCIHAPKKSDSSNSVCRVSYRGNYVPNRRILFNSLIEIQTWKGMEAILPVEALPADSSCQKDFKIITTIRSDGLLENPPTTTSLPPGFKPSRFYMPQLHRDRMLAAVEAFNWPQNPTEVISNLEEFLSAHLKYKYKDSHYTGPLKVCFPQP